MEEIKFGDIMRNPHFSQFASLISVPFRSLQWRDRHSDVPFWTYIDRIKKLMHDGGLDNQSLRDEFISEFTSLITRLVEADPKLYYRLDDMDWFVEVMNGEYATVTMSMLFAMASSRPMFATPVQVAEATGTHESGWRNKAASGEIIGAVKYGKQWLIPVTSLRAYGVNVEVSSQEVDEEESNQ